MAEKGRNERPRRESPRDEDELRPSQQASERASEAAPSSTQTTTVQSVPAAVVRQTGCSSTRHTSPSQETVPDQTNKKTPKKKKKKKLNRPSVETKREKSFFPFGLVFLFLFCGRVPDVVVVVGRQSSLLQREQATNKPLANTRTRSSGGSGSGGGGAVAVSMETDGEGDKGRCDDAHLCIFLLFCFTFFPLVPKLNLLSQRV
jgi:hypothetical protein